MKYSVIFILSLSISYFGTNIKPHPQHEERKVIMAATEEVTSSGYATYKYWNEICLILAEAFYPNLETQFSIYKEPGIPPITTDNLFLVDSIIGKIKKIPISDVDEIAINGSLKLIQTLDFFKTKQETFYLGLGAVGASAANGDLSSAPLYGLDFANELKTAFVNLDHELFFIIKRLEEKYNKYEFKKPIMYLGQEYNLKTVLRSKSIQVLNLSDQLKIKRIMKIQGISCKESLFGRYSEEEALNNLKLKAAQLDADGITELKLSKQGWRTHCYKKLIYTAYAVKVIKGN